MFTYEAVITLRDADAGGVLFFARYLALAHDAYEAFLRERGVGFAQMLDDGEIIIPIVHAESDHRAPCRVGETVTISLTVAEVRRRSFTVTYEFHTSSGELACTAKTIHVVVDLQKKRAIPLPDHIASALTSE
ncbi:MAG: acyl-CoA thioesterase [bacterium]|nr:acyl-CoA thioesterase [bacterium]